MAKLSVVRGTNLTRIPRNITSTEAWRMVESAGFKLVRSGSHRIYRHEDGTQLTLPSTGTLSPWLTQLIHKAVNSYDEAGNPKEGEKKLPLTVTHHGQTYAVLSESESGINYKLMSLRNGSQNWVPKRECIEVVSEGPIPLIEPREEAATIEVPSTSDTDSDPVVEQPQPEPKAEAPMMPTNGSDRDIWLRVTNSYISTFDAELEKIEVEIEQLYNKADSIEKQRDALKAMMAMVTGQPAPTPSSSNSLTRPVGTQTPDGRTRTRERLPQATIDRIYAMARAGDSPHIDIAAALNISQSTVSRYVREGREKGLLPRNN